MIFFVSYFLAAALFIFAAIVMLAQLDFDRSVTSFVPMIAPFAISSFLAILFGWIYGRLFEDVPFRGLGCAFTNGWLGHLTAGIGIGVAAFCLAIIVAVSSGGLSLTLNRESSGSAILATLWTTLIIFVVGALSEETLFRGYLLQTFFRARMRWFGIGITSLLFALAHRNNPEVGYLPLFNTLLAGVWFAIAYAKTRDLWFPLGAHLAWNWLQGPVFGINVSGLSDLNADPILRAHDAGPVWLTGGVYGMEGGVACTVAIAVAIALTHYLPGMGPSEELLELTSREKPIQPVS